MPIPARSPSRVAVIGGGLAGMSAAHALADSRLAVTLFESRRRPGGRAGSFLDTSSNQEVDYCQHVAMGCCTNLRKLLCESGLAVDWEEYATLRFLDPEGRFSHVASLPCLPAPLHLSWSLINLRFLPVRDRLQTARILFRLMRIAPHDADRWPNFGAWLNQHGASPMATRRFWKVIIESALGAPLEAVAVAPARKVFVDGFAATQDAYHVLVPRRPLSDIFGTDLQNHLRHRGVTIRCGESVGGIVPRDTGVELHIGDRAETFDKIVVAVPWRQLPRIDGIEAALPSSALQTIAQFPTSSIAGIHLWTDRPLTEFPHIVFVDRFVQWIFSGCLTTPTQRGEYYSQVVISHAAQLESERSEETVDRVCNELRAAFPLAANFHLHRAKVVNDRHAVFAVTRDVEAARPAARTAHRDLYLAGDYTATGWPATMEGAVISGFAAAESVLADLGQPHRIVAPPPRLGPLARWLIRPNSAPVVPPPRQNAFSPEFP